MNPLVPTTLDVAWSLFALASLVFAVVALVSLFRTHETGRTLTVVWTLLIVLLPFLGSAGWFVASRRLRHTSKRARVAASARVS